MHRPHLLVMIAGLAAIWPSLAMTEPQLAPEIEAGPVCSASPAAARPRLAPRVTISMDVPPAQADRDFQPLNNRGYGYRVAEAGPVARPEARTDEPSAPR